MQLSRKLKEPHIKVRRAACGSSNLYMRLASRSLAIPDIEAQCHYVAIQAPEIIKVAGTLSLPSSQPWLA